jgi:cytoskeleton protein RodZ
VSEVGIGSVLHEARIAMGRGISEAAAATSMRAAQVEALESDRFEMFGGDVYAKGFLKLYAKYLELDPEPLLALYRRTVQHDGLDPLALSTGPIRSNHGSDVPRWLLRGAAVAGVFAMFIGMTQLVQSRTPTPDDFSDVPFAAPEPAVTPTESASATTTPPDSTSVPVPVQTFDGIELTLAFEGASWVSVTIDGQTRQEGVFSQGDVLDLRGDEEVIVRLGNAGGVRALFNGSGIGPFGGEGDVLEIRFTPNGFTEV